MRTRPKRRFGQHFLESAWIDKLVAVIAPRPTDVFLEIGPGRGELTIPLAERSDRVLAVEIDRALVAELTPRVPANVSMVAADVLALDLASLGLPHPSRAVGNLPYNVASQILVKLLDFSAGATQLTDATLMLQREVADRVTAMPGTRDWGPLAVASRLAAEPTRVMAIPPGAFRPMPKVQSAVVRLVFRRPPVQIGDRGLFDNLVRQLFTQRRKTAANALKAFAARHTALPVSEIFERAGIETSRRPGQLDLSELAELSAVLASARV